MQLPWLPAGGGTTTSAPVFGSIQCLAQLTAAIIVVMTQISTFNYQDYITRTCIIIYTHTHTHPHARTHTDKTDKLNESHPVKNAFKQDLIFSVKLQLR